MDTFNDKVAVITGGASGIGLAVGRALAAQGAKLVIADIEQAALDAAVQGLTAGGSLVEGVLTDVGDRGANQRLADVTWERFGGAHIVMLNAGVVPYGSVQDVTLQDWTWSMRVNLWGVINGVDVFLPRMLQGGEEGHFVLTASFAGLVPNRSLAAYNVAKAGVVALAESLHQDLWGSPIRTSLLCPMFVATRIQESARNRPAELGGPGVNGAHPDHDDSPMLSAEDVAAVVLDGLRHKRLYLQTHSEAEKYIANRFDRIRRSFEHLG